MDVSQTKTYDGYGRLSGETVTKGDDQAVLRTYTYKDLSSTRTTAQVQTLSTSFGNNTRVHNYTYDSCGRITSDITASSSYVYEYDSSGQLVWEKSSSKGKAWQYTYDLGGNILSKTEYDYANGTVGDQTSQKLYAYGDSEWHDLLTSYNGSPITYDTIGNPLSYRGWTMDWQAGRQLRSMSKNSTSMSFEYDESGLRTKKTVGSDETRYIWNGNRLVAQLSSSADFFFHYDAAGEMIGYTYAPASGTEIEYYFVKNLQGDIERVVTSTGSIAAQYTYDAWGNVLTSTGSLAGVNPIRYRGYYYDTETGLYYLKSRYYDPQVGRFINADSQFDDNGGIVGYNLFAYAANDPIQFIDENGQAVLPYPGFIHQAVVHHIVDTHPGFYYEQTIDYNNGAWGRADVISPDGQVWEVKSVGAISNDRKMGNARKQIDRYVNNGTWKIHPDIKTRKGDPIIDGSFNLHTRYINFHVEYDSVEQGLVRYAFTYKYVPEQVLSDIGKTVMLGSTAAVFMLSGGSILIPSPVY